MFLFTALWPDFSILGEAEEEEDFCRPEEQTDKQQKAYPTFCCKGAMHTNIYNNEISHSYIFVCDACTITTGGGICFVLCSSKTNVHLIFSFYVTHPLYLSASFLVLGVVFLPCFFCSKSLQRSTQRFVLL